MLLLEYNNIEKFNYTINGATYEKIVTSNGCYKMQTLRNYKKFHVVEINHKEKTLTINGVKFNTSYEGGYTYKKLRGNNIGCSSFTALAEHIKESTCKGSPFIISTFHFLKKLSKKVNYQF